MENNNQKIQCWVSAFDAASVALLRVKRLAGAEAIEQAAGDGQAAQAEPLETEEGRGDHGIDAEPHSGDVVGDVQTHGDTSQTAELAEERAESQRAERDGEADEIHDSDLALKEGRHQAGEENAAEHGQQPLYVVMKGRDGGVGNEDEGPGSGGHGSSSCFGVSGQICQKESWELHLDLRRDATVKPVLHTLYASLGLVVAE